MKITHLTLASMLLALVAGGTNAQTTRENFERVLSKTMVNRQMEKGTYLGLATSSASRALREQLKLKPGIGLVIERVENQSPAELAGVKQFDLIQKLDDQWLVNSEQLAVLVRMHLPGDQIALSLIRQGQPQTITVKLIEKEVPALSSIVTPQGQDVLLKSGNGVIMTSGNSIGSVDVILPGIKREPGAVTISPFSATTWNMTGTDGQTLKLSRDGNSSHLNVTDTVGNVLFDGQIDTEEQWKAVPADIAPKANQLLRMSGQKMFPMSDLPGPRPTEAKPAQ